MAKKIMPWIKGFLTAYAMRAVINAPLKAEWYEDKADFFTNSVFELLGRYDFVFLFFWIVCAVFFLYMEGRALKKDTGITVLSLVFAALIPLGQVLLNIGTLSALFGSVVNVIKAIFMIAGFFLFFREGLSYLADLFQKKNFVTKETDLIAEHIFFAGFLVLETVFFLCVLTNFPGNLCYDTEGQMMQVLGEMPYSTHHPLLSTFLMGLPVKASVAITGSKAPGIFVYMIIQSSMLAAALASTLSVLKKRGVKSSVLLTLLLIYTITPVYSNIASTAVKDVPFISAFIGYFVCLVLVTDDIEVLKDRRFAMVFVLMQILTCLLRKNGYYIVIFTGIIWCIGKIKSLGFKGVLKTAVTIFVAGVLAAILADAAMAKATNAAKGSAGEAFSLPFQITALYIDRYSDELTDEEISAISGVLGDDMKGIADRYNPYLADAVKALYNKDAGAGEISAYVGVWIKMFFKHPGAYFDGFFVHTFGWYCPNVTTATRYETVEDDFYAPSGVFATLDKVMIFVYRFADRISLLGALQNAGLAVWAFWFLTYLQKKNRLRAAGIPLWVSFAVCLMAPGFMEHTRYAFPIIMTMPFFFTYTLTTFDTEACDEKA